MEDILKLVIFRILCQLSLECVYQRSLINEEIQEMSMFYSLRAVNTIKCYSKFNVEDFIITNSGNIIEEPLTENLNHLNTGSGLSLWIINFNIKCCFIYQVAWGKE